MWFFFVPLVGSLVTLGFLYWKRQSHPLNLFLLGLFTFMEALSLGILVAAMDRSVVLKAVFITTFMFAGLTSTLAVLTQSLRSKPSTTFPRSSRGSTGAC